MAAHEERLARNRLQARVPMAELLGSQYVQRAIEQHALHRACFPALAACSSHFLDSGEPWSDAAVACAAASWPAQRAARVLHDITRAARVLARPDHPEDSQITYSGICRELHQTTLVEFCNAC